jgi:uncharacterized protein (DUF433 family)
MTEIRTMSPKPAHSTEILPGHPHVVQTEGICGGRARIRGTRISVRTIAEFLLRDEPFEEIAATYPHVAPAALQDAIDYYLDHRLEIEAEIEANRPDKVLNRVGATLDSKGVVRFRDSSG